MQNGLRPIFLNLIFKPNFKEEDISYINTKRDALRPFLYSNFVLFALFFVLSKKLNSFFELKTKTRSLIHLRFNLDLTAMGLNDVFHDGQS